MLYIFIISLVQNHVLCICNDGNKSWNVVNNSIMVADLIPPTRRIRLKETFLSFMNGMIAGCTF